MTTLSELGILHGTDKVTHAFHGVSYLTVYDWYFNSIKSKQMNVLEIGVKEGQSLRMWEEYFYNSTIYGLDIDPACRVHEKGRVKIVIGSQADKKVLDTFGALDIVIDDGSHVNELTVASFNALFPKLKSGGLYIIEDMYPTYLDISAYVNDWPGMQYNTEVNYNNQREDLDRVFQDMIKKLDYGEGNALFVHFWHQMCIIKKI